MDFARIIEVFDQHGVSFVSVTQQFNTTNSIGRLTLNILLSFAQFEREIISERTRDKMSAARRKGKWIGGHPVLGYDIDPKGGRIVVNPEEAEQVRAIFGLYVELGSLLPVLQEAERRGRLTKRWTTEDGKVRGGQPIPRARSMASSPTPSTPAWSTTRAPCIRASTSASSSRTRGIESMKLSGGTTPTTAPASKTSTARCCVACSSACRADTAMVHTYTTRKSKRYRYYVCYNAQQQGWKNCETKSVPAQAIETAVLDSIRRLAAIRNWRNGCWTKRWSSSRRGSRRLRPNRRQ